MTFNVSAAGSYQLKFYSTTYDVDLNATASLASGAVSDSVAGTYVSAGTEKYVYTVDFTTIGADTLTLDLVKTEGGNFIFAYEAFSLKSVGDNGGGTTYTITFINVDDSQTTQTVGENVVATPPAGVNTDTRTFTSWPTIAPATADATYTALYSEVNATYTITFVNVDDTVTTYTADAGVVLTPPTGVNTATRTFTSWPTVVPASADATYTALYTVDVGSADVLWDGEGTDDLWSTPENWSGDTLPANGQTVKITNGDTVDLPANYWDLATGLTVNVAGNSLIGNTGGAGRLFGPSTYNFLAGSGITGQWIYLHQVTLNFENGATFDASTVEHRQEITYAITLTGTGFTTLTPGFLRPFGESTLVRCKLRPRCLQLQCSEWSGRRADRLPLDMTLYLMERLMHR